MNKMTKNMFASVFYIATYMITNFLVQQRILVAYGSDVNGISSSVSQFLSYLILLEAGIGTASIQALYKPLSNDDWSDINSIISATSKQYNKIGKIFLVFVLVIALFLAITVSGQLDAIFVIIFTIVSGLNTLFSYVLVGKYNVFLSANQQSSIIYIVDTILLIISCALKIIMIEMGISILFVQALSAISTMLKSIILYLYIRKKYKQLNLKVTPAFDKLGKHKSVMVHNVAGLVVNHIPVTLLTVASTLKIVSLYSVYNLIYSSISNIFNTVFATAIQGNFGYYATQGDEEYKKSYYAFEFFYSIILYAILTIALLLTLPFISLYAVGVNDINYINANMAFLFFLNQLMSLIRIPTVLTIKAYGWFRETQKGAVVEAIINLVASVVLFALIGIEGLLIGTFCSYLYRTQDTIVFVYKRLKLRKSFFIKNNLINIFVTVILVIFFMIIKPITVSGWFNWILTAFVVAFVVIMAFVVTNVIFNFKEFKINIVELKRLFLKN